MVKNKIKLKIFSLKIITNMVTQKYSSELVKLRFWKENELTNVKIAVYAFKRLGESIFAKKNTNKLNIVHC